MMMKLIVTLCVLVLAGCAITSIDAFVTPSTTVVSSAVVPTTTTTELYAANGPPDTATKDIPYGETSRQFRRTVYTHDDWVKHRSPNRFIKNLSTIVSSGVYKVRYILSERQAKRSELVYSVCLPSFVK